MEPCAEHCLDFHNPEFRIRVAKRAEAAVDSGAGDGVMLDWWSDDDSRSALTQEVRKAIGESALILANANDRQTPQTGRDINGYFMECTESKSPQDWKKIAETLARAEANLREPRINCLETWYHQSRDNLNLMRATTTLTLTLSDNGIRGVSRNRSESVDLKPHLFSPRKWSAHSCCHAEKRKRSSGSWAVVAWSRCCC